MTRIVTSAVVDSVTLQATLAPRDGLVAERSLGDGTFEAVAGPVCGYRRCVVAVAQRDGCSAITQTVEYRLSIPFFAWVFRPGFRRHLSCLGAVSRGRWWSAPERLDAEAFTVLGCLAALAVITGYLSTLITQTITFAAQEFHAGKPAQGVALAVVRADIVLSVGLVALADRSGRRTVALWSAVLGSGFTAVGALSPSLAALVGTQVTARGFVTAVTIAISVLAAEAMPAGSRAYAIGFIAIASAIGSGVAVLALPLADLGVAGWRLLYAGGLLGIPLSFLVTRRLPESRRFRAHHRPPRARPTSASAIAPRRSAAFSSRLTLLSIGALLFNLFVVPASQFQNEYLRRERHFSAAHITLFTVVTVLPGALGIVWGGRLADTRGRRVVGSLATAGSAVAAVVFYLSRGWPMWVFATGTSIIGGAVYPALVVYGPELFATASRGLANGLITGAGRVGSVIGLIVAGVLSSAFGHFGPAFALLAIGPIGLAILVITAFPETAHRELEDLNPEDR